MQVNTVHMKKALLSMLRKTGYQIVRVAQPDPLLSDDAFQHVYAECKPYTMTSEARCYALYRAVRYIIENNVLGDFVECGVWRGGSAMLMARVLQEYGAGNRALYLYDTYAGMSEPTDEDKKASGKGGSAAATWQALQKPEYNDWCYAGLEEVRENVRKVKYPDTKTHFIKGDVADTLKQKTPERIAILRLDTDWYESTKLELEVLFPKLTKGGVLIIDDYGSWQGAKKAVDEYPEIKHLLLNRIDNTGMIGVKI